MSYMMDYGDDWPPPPAPPAPAPQPRRHRLAVRCAAVVVTYALIAAFGLVLLHVREAETAHARPAQVADTRGRAPGH